MTTLAFDDTVLDARLTTIAKLGRIVVATDFDGTLAPIALDPATVQPVAGAEAALASLAALEHTTVAVVSGRDLADLDARLSLPVVVRVMGSYGAEERGAPPEVLSPAERRRWRQIVVEFERLVQRYPGSRVEYKTFGAAFHVRAAADPTGAVGVAMAVAATVDGTYTMTGKMVVETTVRELSKAAVVARLREEHGAFSVIYLGDDDADEAVFADLRPRDLGIRVGPSPDAGTAATVSVADPDAAVGVLQRLASLRAG